MIHILCTNCSEDLAEIMPAYQAVKNAYFAEVLKQYGTVDLDRIDFKADILPSIAFIFEALHINNQCCRLHVLGTEEFDL